RHTRFDCDWSSDVCSSDLVTQLIEQCKKAGAKHIFLVTPPIYDFAPRKDEFNYDAVLTEYAKWQTELKVTGVTVIDLHTAMRKEIGRASCRERVEIWGEAE